MSTYVCTLSRRTGQSCELTHCPAMHHIDDFDTECGACKEEGRCQGCGGKHSQKLDCDDVVLDPIRMEE